MTLYFNRVHNYSQDCSLHYGPMKLHIIESHENLAGETLIEPHPSTTIYLGHLDELHYVSTAAVTSGSDALENQHSSF